VPPDKLSIALVETEPGQSKRRHAGGATRPTAEPESYVANLAGQEVSELLGQAFRQINHVGGGLRDQDTFLLSIHGTQVRLVTSDYPSCVNSPMMPPLEKLFVRKSAPYDLKYHEERVGLLHLLVGLFGYLMSGEAEVAQLQHVFISS
jgi:hypothetical protein